MVAAAPLRRSTAADLAQLPPGVRAELADAQGGVIVHLRGPFHRRPGGGQPGGWWILPEVEIELDPHEIYCPDIAGWRRERTPERPHGRPVTIRPDWVCEVLSPSNASNDLVTKLRVYHRSQVGHYWIVDPQNEMLTVLRWTPDGYLAALTAGRADRVRAEPFEAVELPVGVLFGDEVE